MIADVLFWKKYFFTLINRWAGADVSRRNSISFVLDPICFASNAFSVMGTSKDQILWINFNKVWNFSTISTTQFLKFIGSTVFPASGVCKTKLAMIF